MKEKVLDSIIVGAGFAGLSASYYLKKHGLDHIVFERGRIGESWLSQRWDSFRLNTSMKINSLPGTTWNENTDEFCSAPCYVDSFKEYVSTFQLPVSENSKVVSIEKPGDFFTVTVSVNNAIKNYFCRQVVIASGHANELSIPPFAKKISASIKQLHTSEYRNSGQLPGGTVLVVGSAQSGCQIAEDLADAGRKVFLSTSMVARVPRRYRGRDIVDWLIDVKFLDIRADELEDPKMLEMKPPQLTGLDGGKRTISLQSLAKKGIVILGKMDNADEQNVFFQPNAAMHVKFSDGFSKKVKEMIDGFILKNQVSAPPPEIDVDDQPDIEASCANSAASLDLRGNNISSIVWATGFKGDFGFLKLPVFDDNGDLKHQDGIAAVPGLYLIGLPWLRARKSAILFGIRDDAAFIAGKVFDFANKNVSVNVVQ
jgi:putative flavoprotein involved in K+ transport